MTQIVSVAHALPEQIVVNNDLSNIMETSDEWIRSRTGIVERRISQDENTSDLATRVAKHLLEQKAISANEIDFIIVATVTPDAQMPSTAAIVQSQIGAVNAFAYDLTAACSGFVFALSTADKLIQSGVYRRGIVVGAEVLSKMIDWSDRSTAVLFGDGAGGVLLEASDEPLILAEKLQTDGSRGMSLSLNLLGPNSPFSSKVDDQRFLHMDGRSIFDFAVRDVPKNVAETLRLANLTESDIDYFLLHQANSRILDKMAKKLDVSRDKFLQNLEYYGNTSAASIPILLSEVVKSGKIRFDGTQKVALIGFGGGLTWGTLVINI